MPASDPALADAGQRAWRAHLGQTCSETETAGYFAAWAQEDVYFELDEERSMLQDAGFSTDVVWRRVRSRSWQPGECSHHAFGSTGRHSQHRLPARAGTPGR